MDIVTEAVRCMMIEDTKDVLCIVPVCDNASVLCDLLANLKKEYQNIFVVDDCSEDESASIIRDAWALPICRHIPGDGFFVLYHERRLGLRKTLLEALDMARSAGFSELVVVNPENYLWRKPLNIQDRNLRSWFFRLRVKSLCGF